MLVLIDLPDLIQTSQSAIAVVNRGITLIMLGLFQIAGLFFHDDKVADLFACSYWNLLSLIEESGLIVRDCIQFV
ncbi:hypothetical protein NIES4075_52080 [Tolypothrix sp. NIES-4075]|uniref:hypothetical protein n=1 Tax=Tolypothrix sp. NIES-4075 TaxID=2005459 RepID=UPI000B5C3DB6|nr:hypothetical protein [Tolypothrix sp. NIES-4075]GAX44191.1 hypothetical protein NIES4075_52080 [Tolypothrix sp. NIES-4075]